MEKESKLLRKVGTQNPFKTPEGYFEGFTQELMNKLPEKEAVLTEQEITLWQRVKPWIYMTAMFCGIMLSMRIFVGIPEHQNDFADITPSEIDELSDHEWENIVSRSMISNYTLYQLLTDNEPEEN